MVVFGDKFERRTLFIRELFNDFPEIETPRIDMKIFGYTIKAEF